MKRSNNVTVRWLRSKGACREGIDRFIRNHGQSEDLRVVVEGHISDGTLDYASWLIVKKMTHAQQIMCAIYAAEQVIDIYERRFADKRPREAIEVAKLYISKPNDVNRTAADAAAYAARAAARAADAAAYAAADAADAAYAAAAYAAARAADAGKGMKEQIIRYGLSIFTK